MRAQRDDGFIGHTIFWGEQVSRERARRYNVVERADHTTATIQPPLLAWSWEIVAQRSGEKRAAFVAEGLETLERHYDWLARERALGDSDLLTLIQPDESGLDASPKFDSVWGPRCCGLPGFLLLVRRNRRHSFDARRIAAAHPREHVREVLTNVLYMKGLCALVRIGGDARFAHRAERAQAELVERCYEPRTGLFFDLAGDDDHHLRTNTWSALAPLALDGLPDEIVRRLVEEQLLDPQRYATPVPIASVSADEQSFNPGADERRLLFVHLRRYWRGPSWVNTAWLLVPALRRLGYQAEADRLLAPLLDAMEREGLREYYNARTGEGLGARDFGWSALALELL
ncbi:MAG: hypothetical protein WDZ37_06350 [Solirubrobacterales bacterium]